MRKNNILVHQIDKNCWLFQDRYQVFLNSININSVEPLYRALVLLDWKHGFKVSSFLERHRPAVLQAVQSKQLTSEYDSQTVLYYMSRDEAAALDIVLDKIWVWYLIFNRYLLAAYFYLEYIAVRMEFHFDQCHRNMLLLPMTYGRISIRDRCSFWSA